MMKKFFIAIMLLLTIGVSWAGVPPTAPQPPVSTISEIDALVDYGGGTIYTQATIAAAYADVGIVDVTTIVLRSGTWVISTNFDLSVYTNVTLKIVPGAVLQIATGTTTTIPKIDENGSHKRFVLVGTGTVHLLSTLQVLPEWWGAKNDGTEIAATTAAVKAAMESLPSVSSVQTGGDVIFGVGKYAVNNIPITKPGVRLIGQGVGTNIEFTTATPGDSCFLIGYVEPGYVYNIEISNMNISSDTAQGNVLKYAIKIINASQVKVKNVRIVYWRGNNLSYGIIIKGREFLSFDNVEIYGDKGIGIEINTDHPTLCADHTTFNNLYVVAEQGEIINVQDGAMLSDVSFTGHQSWVPKTYGLYWSDTTAPGQSNNVSFENVRIEQETSATAYMFYLSTTGGLRGLSIKNSEGGTTAKGLYLRGITEVNLDTFHYVNAASNEAMNADATVGMMSFTNCFWQTGTTASLAIGKAEAGIIIGRTDLPTTGYINRNASFTDSFIYKSLTGRRFQLALDAVEELCGNAYAGKIVVTIAVTSVGEYELLGNRNLTREVRDGDAIFSVTKDNAGTLNIYWDAGASKYVLQNKYAAGVYLNALFVGAYN